MKKPSITTTTKENDIVSTSVLRYSEVEALDYTNFCKISPEQYASWYLGSCYPRVPFHDEQIILDFLVDCANSIDHKETLIEFGCGPVISHAIPFVNKVDQIILTDYLEDNLEMIRSWITKDSNSHDWSLHVERIMEREGSKIYGDKVLEREDLLRSKIKLIARADLREKTPIKSIKGGIVSCIYSTEQAAESEDEWLQILSNLKNTIKPNGYLLLVCVKDTSYYAIHDKNKTTLKIPIVNITKELIENGLRNLGFKPKDVTITSADVSGLEDEGMQGIFLIKAKLS